MNDKKYFLHYIKQLVQLVLSPSRGWEDVSYAVHNPDELQRRGFVPLLAITGLSEFLPLIYSHGKGFVNCLLSGFIICAGLFCSLYVARLFMEMTFGKYVFSKMNPVKLNIYITCLMGINCFYTIISNAVPASMTLLKLLPLLSVNIIFRATAFMGIGEENQLTFTGLSIIAVLLCPAAICCVLLLLV